MGASGLSSNNSRFGSPSTIIMLRSLLTQRDAISSPAESSPLSRMPPWMMPFIHSYKRDIAGVVRMIEVSGGRSFLTRRGSRGVKIANYIMLARARNGKSSVLTSLMSLIAIQLFPLSTRSSNSLGARGKKSWGLRQPNSQTTFTIAAVTLGCSFSSINRSFIFGHAGFRVSG
jgi:hypothetical protein